MPPVITQEQADEILAEFQARRRDEERHRSEQAAVNEALAIAGLDNPETLTPQPQNENQTK